MSDSVADRNLLFGLLALQTGLIDQSQLVAAFQAWTLQKDRLLADQLVGRGDLDADARAAVEALVAQHIKKHGGSTAKSLAALAAGRSTRESLAQVGAPDLEGTLARVGRGATASQTTDDADRTASYVVGTATPDGQRFRVLRPHANGGLGAVFVALDEELHREVALKQILEQHADDTTSRARFLLEAEITGGLEHPGIVPVYGLGTYGDGRPYYAMRFIRGDSLKEAIGRFHGDPTGEKDPGNRMLELRQLLRKFTDVCHAIEYAHSRGVVHRDIKPGNIIVGKHGETLVVDWGLAKVLGRTESGVESGERTLVLSSSSSSAETLPGSALGTPAYMSPEQAEGDLEHLSPRSDVYSLGATLYCLLTGRPPFEGDVGEVLRAVQRHEFPPPRQRDATIDPALEAICLKAMAHKPGDRYSSARALAEDLERWMADEPVSAWREPLTRRARRWGRRHRTMVTAAVATVLVALAGTGAVLAVRTRANRELKRANTELAIARDNVVQSNADLQAANGRERQRFGLAMEAIELFHGEVSEDLLLKEKRFASLRVKLLQGAAGFYGKLEGLLQGQTDPKSRADLGRAYFELADLTLKIGNKAAALIVHRKALAVRRELAARPEADDEARLDVVRSLKEVGFVQFGMGDAAGELASYLEARALAEALIAAGRGSDEARFVLAECLIGPADLRPEEGLEEARRALAIMKEVVGTNPSVTRYQEELSKCHFVIAYSLSKMGRLAEAIAAYQESAAILQRLADTQPEVFRFQDTLAKVHHNCGSLLWRVDQRFEALASRRRAVAIWQRASDANPAVSALSNNVAYGLSSLASDLNDLGRPAEAMEALALARPILQTLTDYDPSSTSYPKNLAQNYFYTGAALARMGLSREARETYEKAVAIREKLAHADPSNTYVQTGLLNFLAMCGWSLWKTGQPTEAVAMYDRAREVRQKLANADMANADDRDSIANCETGTAAALTKVGRLTEARACADRAIAIREDLIKGQPANDLSHQDLAESLLRSGGVRRAVGDTVGAAADWRHATALYASHHPSGLEGMIIRACCHGSLAGLAGVEGAGVSIAEGAAQAEEAMALLRRAVASGFRDIGLLQVESGLDPLRSRDDFRLLMMDLAMPAEPFAHGD